MVHRNNGKTQRFLYSMLTGEKINNSHFSVRFYFYRIKTTPFKVNICFYFNLLRKYIKFSQVFFPRQLLSAGFFALQKIKIKKC